MPGNADPARQAIGAEDKHGKSAAPEPATSSTMSGRESEEAAAARMTCVDENNGAVLVSRGRGRVVVELAAELGLKKLADGCI